MVGYGVMNLAMTATPLAMESAGHHFHHVSMTIQWHVVAMFLPSFFTGHLAARFGARQVIVAGSLLLVASALVTQWDIGWAGFNVALVLLGLGWNFTFLPATGLLTESYRPVDKARTQAANEFFVFGTAAMTALAAGPLVKRLGVGDAEPSTDSRLDSAFGGDGLAAPCKLGKRLKIPRCAL